MIIIMEFIFNLIPVIILKKIIFLKQMYNDFRYYFYNKYGKNVPLNFFLLIPPL